MEEIFYTVETKIESEWIPLSKRETIDEAIDMYDHLQDIATASRLKIFKVTREEIQMEGK